MSTHAVPHAVNGAVHVATHAPDWQKGADVEQTRPHRPQFVASASSERHTPPHETVPTGQVHDPASHVSSDGQAAPHAPQFSGSVPVSAHAVPHVS